MRTHGQRPCFFWVACFYCLLIFASCMELARSQGLFPGPGPVPNAPSVVDNVLETAEEAVDGPMPESDPSAEPPPLPEPTPKDATPLGVDISVIRIIDHQDKADLNSEFSIRDAVMTEGDFLFPGGLLAELESLYVGQPISLELLDGVIRFIIEAYRETDYPLVDVYLPEQDITEGKLQVVVREALLGEVKVEGAEYSRPRYLVRQVRIEPGERLNTWVLEQDIDWMNTNPGRRVDIIYERGEEDGTSDIILQTTEVKPYSTFVSFGNTGVKATGENEFTVGYRNTNVLGTEQSISYNFSGDNRFNNLHSHVMVYETPLPWRHRFEMIGAYVTSQVPGAGNNPLDVEGESIIGTFNYKIPLTKLNRKHVHNANISVDYKSTNSDILFGGTNFFASQGVVLQGRLGYEITIKDRDLPGYDERRQRRLGRMDREDRGIRDTGAGESEDGEAEPELLPPSRSFTSYSFGLVGSPGNLVAGNSTADYDSLRDKSVPYYWYVNAGIQRLQQLPEDWNLLLNLDSQLTNERLIATEQIRAGGYRTVRGFDESLIRGDYGFQFSAEVSSPYVPVLDRWCDQIDDQANVYLFYDNAFLFSNELPGEGNLSQSLQSLGFGIKYRAGTTFQLRLTYGVPIYYRGLLASPENDKLHFGVTTTF